ncbi:hypothetical protein [Anaerosporobacter faecicola]|uniref:hypothetical protein n=1 Tax=Anaerosporobacter faecicola TaxID=2718714 RepID=UPI00143AB6E8|nr:hypothetical protein [Anaerosporobacter faecicola]
MKKGIYGILGIALGSITTLVINKKLITKSNIDERKKVDKFRGYYALLNQWLINKNNSKEISEYFIKNQYKNIAIYGLGELGNRLINELENTEINISYGIDKEDIFDSNAIKIYSIDNELPEVDVIVVTATFAFNEIYNDLVSKVNCPIISLDDIIFGL